MTTLQIPGVAGIRFPDALRDRLLALLSVILVICVVGVALAASVLGPLAPSVQGGPGLIPSARAQAAPLPPDGHR